MNKPTSIPVFIRNPDGDYLAQVGNEWSFTKNPAQAHVFDYHADEVEQQLQRAHRDLGVIWIAYPADPNLLSEICDLCGRKLIATEAYFDGSRSLCPACRTENEPPLATKPSL